jgi:DNA-binding transcriptional MerR regulator
MWQEEVRTRLGRLPEALIRLASSRLPCQERDDYADEWRAELTFVLRDTDGLPLTRLLRGTSYALGLLRVSRGIARELSSNDESEVDRVESPPSSAPEITILSPSVGFQSATACMAAGITFKQLDYWARTGLVVPSVRAASSSGPQRLYGFRDILALKIVKRLLDTGISLQQIRAAVAYLRKQGASDVAQLTLMSDGASVYACTSPDEVVDLLQGGHGVFGVAMGRVWQEVEGTLAELPAELT